MKKYLLPESGSFYKANLHCHTTCSDGKRTPEQIKNLYKSRGYSIIAYTDHNVMLDHSALNDSDFLALVGYEIDITEPEFCSPRKTCHLCFIALERGLNQVCWHRDKYLGRGAIDHRDEAKFDESLPDYERYYTKAGINDIIKKAKEGGFFVTYNHPFWSLESYPEYTSYEGMDAMEIYNYSSASMGFDEINSHEYDDMLRTGKHIYCVAADDNHNNHPDDSPKSDSCGGYTVIKADNLEYRTITKALEDGNFYSSMGPEIKELYIEDGKLHITTSDAVAITLNTGVRRAAIALPTQGEFVNEATFAIKETDVYVRLTVIDERGKRAWTSAYFVGDIL